MSAITIYHNPDCGTFRNTLTLILISRPIVVTPLGTRLCRPSEAVLDILASPQLAPFAKEDGEPVIDAVTLERSRRVAS